MKTLFSTIFLLTFIFFSNAQETLCDCSRDLEFASQKIQTMPSFKKQIKGSAFISYQNTYNELLEQSKEPISVLDCFEKLNTLLFQVKDRHAAILHNAEELNKVDLNDEFEVSRFRESKTFQNHPRSKKDLEELKTLLNGKKYEDIEGVYQYGTQMTVGVYKTSQKTFNGVILSTLLPQWDAGQIVFRLTQRTSDTYDILRYSIKNREMRSIQGMLHSDGRIWSLKKKSAHKEYTMADFKEHWEFKQLSKDVQYFYFGSFSNAKDNVARFKVFYDSIQSVRLADNIIIDLRNNSGGNSKYSDPFVKLFKKSKAKLVVLTNFYTASNGEQMTLKLIKQCEAVHVGQRTMGTIAYGLNYGTSYDLPSGHFKIRPTDMNFHKFIEYEVVGINPKRKLDLNKNWLDQTLELI